jgi:hypothetical protein
MARILWQAIGDREPGRLGPNEDMQAGRIVGVSISVPIATCISALVVVLLSCILTLSACSPMASHFMLPRARKVGFWLAGVYREAVSQDGDGRDIADALR